MGKAKRIKLLKSENPKQKKGPGTCLGNFYCMTTRTRLTEDQSKVKQKQNHSRLMKSQTFFEKQEKSLGFDQGGMEVPFNHTLSA